MKTNKENTTFLERQRSIHSAHCKSITDSIRKRADDDKYVAEKIKACELPMRNMFTLPGTGGKPFFVGNPPAWNERKVSDEEYLWLLNRMDWFDVLSETYLLTGDRKYADKIAADIENWIDSCPPPALELPITKEELAFYAGVNPWRTLEVGIRVFSTWKQFYERLLQTDIMTPELHAKIAESFYVHGKILRHVSPALWPNADHNHYLHEMLGLLAVACLFPDYGLSDEWKSYAANEIARCAEKQFTSEGGQIEGCPAYHTICLKMIFDAIALGREYNVNLPESLINICKLACDYAAFSSCPDGNYAAFGDTVIARGCRNAVIGYYKTFGAVDRTARMYPITGKYSSFDIPQSVCEKAVSDGLKIGREDSFQPGIGQYFARTGWSESDSYFAFICHTPVCNGHSHQDPMSFVLYLKGKPVVIDPSFCTYQDGADRRLFKSPEYHSCLTIGGKPPFEYTGNWTYSPQKEGRIVRTYRTGRMFAADAYHKNYEPDIHRRLCALIDDDIFIVADDLDIYSGGTRRLYFHIDDPHTYIENGIAHAGNANVILPHGFAYTVEKGAKSPRNDVKIETSRIIVTDSSDCASPLYLTVFTTQSDISGCRIFRCGDEVITEFTKSGIRRKIVWKFGQSAEYLSGE